MASNEEVASWFGEAERRLRQLHRDLEDRRELDNAVRDAHFHNIAFQAELGKPGSGTHPDPLVDVYADVVADCRTCARGAIETSRPRRHHGKPESYATVMARSIRDAILDVGRTAARIRRTRVVPAPRSAPPDPWEGVLIDRRRPSGRRTRGPRPPVPPPVPETGPGAPPFEHGAPGTGALLRDDPDEWSRLVRIIFYRPEGAAYVDGRLRALAGYRKVAKPAEVVSALHDTVATVRHRFTNYEDLVADVVHVHGWGMAQNAVDTLHHRVLRGIAFAFPSLRDLCEAQAAERKPAPYELPREPGLPP